MADDDIDDTDDIPEADDGDASEGEAVAKPVKPVARLGEIVASALGSTQREWLTKGLGDPLPPPESDSALLARAAARMDHETLRRQAVIDTILYRTLSILPKTVEPGDLDPDWAPRFFAAAADSRDPERQAIWCRMLAMEVARPGSIPLIALHRLPSLSADVLDWMRLFAGFAISNFVVRLPDAFFNERGLTSDVLLLLEEYGLLRTNRDLSKIFRSQVKDRFSTNLLYIDKAFRVPRTRQGSRYKLPAHEFDHAGPDLHGGGTDLVRVCDRDREACPETRLHGRGTFSRGRRSNHRSTHRSATSSP